MHSTWDMAQPWCICCICIPCSSLPFSHVDPKAIPQKIHSFPKTTWHGGHRASGTSMGFPSPWHTWDVCGEASPFECVGRRGMPRCRALTPVSSHRKRHQHQLLGRPQPPGPVLQDGRGVRQVHRVRQKVSSARGCRGGRWGCEVGGTVQAEAVRIFGAVSQRGAWGAALAQCDTAATAGGSATWTMTTM